MAANEAWKWKAGGGGDVQEDEKEENAVELPSCLPPLSILVSSRRLLTTLHCIAYASLRKHTYTQDDEARLPSLPPGRRGGRLSHA